MKFFVNFFILLAFKTCFATPSLQGEEKEVKIKSLMPSIEEIKKLDEFICTTLSHKGFEISKEEMPQQGFQECKRIMNPFLERFQKDDIQTRRALTDLYERTFSNVGIFKHACQWLLNDKPNVDHEYNTYKTVILPHYNVVQSLSHAIFSIFKHYNLITSEAGYETVKLSLPDEKLIFVKASGGYTPFSIDTDAEYQRRAFDYGLPDSNFQRTILLNENKKIITDAGLFFYNQKRFGNIFKMYTGRHLIPKFAPDEEHRFSLSIDAYIVKNTSINRVLNIEEINNLQKGKIKEFFLPLPVDNKDQDEFELLMLEQLVDASRNEAHPDHQLAITYIAELEKQAEMPVEEIITKLERKILTAYEHEIQAEQQQVSFKVATNQVAGLKKAKVKKGKKSKGKQSQATKKALPIPPTIQELANKKLAAYKQEGRIKWAKALSITQQMIREHTASAFLEVNITGSHITYHGDGQAPSTLVRSHGSKDKAMPASRFNHFATGLLKILLEQGTVPLHPS